MEHKKGDKYITHYPGFLKPDKNGKCLPCCFKKNPFDPKSIQQWNRRNVCSDFRLQRSRELAPNGTHVFANDMGHVCGTK